MSTRDLSGGRQWKLERERRAGGVGMPGCRAVQRRRAALLVLQAASGAGCQRLGRVESAAVVCDGDVDALAVGLGRNADLGRARVAQDVGDAFLAPRGRR